MRHLETLSMPGVVSTPPRSVSRHRHGEIMRLERIASGLLDLARLEGGHGHAPDHGRRARARARCEAAQREIADRRSAF
jgi:hypothetical protein